MWLKLMEVAPPVDPPQLSLSIHYVIQRYLGTAVPPTRLDQIQMTAGGRLLQTMSPGPQLEALAMYTQKLKVVDVTAYSSKLKAV